MTVVAAWAAADRIGPFASAVFQQDAGAPPFRTDSQLLDLLVTREMLADDRLGQRGAAELSTRQVPR